MTGGAWVNVLRNQNGDNTSHQTINLTATAAGAADVQIRFHYYDAAFEWYWIVDNVRVSFSGSSGCNLESCVPATAPPDGARMWWGGSGTLEWTSVSDASSYHLYTGPGSALPKLLDAQVDSCLYATTANTSHPGITSAPPVGTLGWWLVRSDGPGGQGPAGLSSFGPRVQDSSGLCP